MHLVFLGIPRSALCGMKCNIIIILRFIGISCVIHISYYFISLGLLRVTTNGMRYKVNDVPIPK